jgi:hypothetical protein
MMRKTTVACVLLSSTLIFLESSVLNSAQPRQEQVPASPFTLEQTAVYHAFFTDFRRGSRGGEAIDISEFTETLQPDEGDYNGCMKSFPRNPAEMTRHLTEDFANENHLFLVDPKLHKIQDPEDGMRNGLSVESAVESGFRSGLLTISEIIFDANRKRAAFHYSFVCGRLCGHSETVVYEKRHGTWKPSKRSCGYGIS